MPSPKRQAVICHKIAALSYLLAEALDELNPEVADSNPFKSNVMPWLISAMKLSVMSLSTRNSLSTYLQNMSTQVDTAIRRNYVRIPGSE
jgi:hypothetical protein